MKVRHVVVIITAWTTVAGGLLYWTISRERQSTRELAQAEAEQARAASERHLRSIIQTAPDTILTVDRDGHIRFINRTVPGTNMEGTIGTNIRDHIPAECYQPVRQAIEYVFLTGEADSVEHTLRPQESTATTWQASRIGPVLEDGEVTAVTIFSTDITERKESEDALRRSVSEVEAFNRLAVGREMRMVELKAQVNSLLGELGRAPEYEEGSEGETALVSAGVSGKSEPCPEEGSNHEH
jgi:PAS domain S-box-containing protein